MTVSIFHVWVFVLAFFIRDLAAHFMFPKVQPETATRMARTLLFALGLTFWAYVWGT